MDEITIGDKTYISSKQAAKITGYAKDYVGQLCREGRVEARLVGRNWYVLDSAIREHRFGKEEEEAAAEEEAPVASTDRVSTWKKPQYEAEMPILVPDFSKKADSNDIGTPAIADMQSAWREWFQDRQQDQGTGETLINDEELEEVRGDVSQAFSDPSPASIYVEEEVTISRVQYSEQQIPADEPSGEQDTEEVVDLHRIYTPKPTPTPAQTSVAKDRSEVNVRRPAREPKAAPIQVEGLGTAVVRSLLIVAAVAVALVALIGTGHADSYLAGTSFDFGVQKEIIDYLGGKSSYESSFK